MLIQLNWLGNPSGLCLYTQLIILPNITDLCGSTKEYIIIMVFSARVEVLRFCYSLYFLFGVLVHERVIAIKVILDTVINITRDISILF